MLERWTQDRSVLHLRVVRAAQQLLPPLPGMPTPLADGGRGEEIPPQLQAMLGAAEAAAAQALALGEQHSLLPPMPKPLPVQGLPELPLPLPHEQLPEQRPPEDDLQQQHHQQSAQLRQLQQQESAGALQGQPLSSSQAAGGSNSVAASGSSPRAGAASQSTHSERSDTPSDAPAMPGLQPGGGAACE